MTIGQRLKEERERLGLSQPSFAGVAETTKKSQIDYEKDITQPKAGYLESVAKVGADVQYIVTGVRSLAGLSVDEEALLSLYRAAPILVRAAAVAALGSGGTQKNKEKYRGATIASVKQKGGSTVQQNFNAPVGRVVPGDLDTKESGNT